MNPLPPKSALRFLHWICPTHLYEGIEGDLLEAFHLDVEERGARAARGRFYFHVLKFFRPGILLRNSIKSPSMINPGLLNNHLKLAWRNLKKNNLYALINLLGLATGIAATLLVASLIRFERSFDTFHPDVDRMYRVNQTAIWSPSGVTMASTQLPLAQVLVSDYPEIEEALRINTPGPKQVRYQQSDGDLLVFNEHDVLAADSNFFDFFDLPLIEGEQATALAGRGKVVLSAEAAHRLFGHEPALGKILLVGDDQMPVQVSGVTAEQPANMHFDFDYLLSMYTNPSIEQFEWSWIWTQVVTYVKLRAGTSPSDLEPKLDDIAGRYVQSTFSRLGMDYESFVAEKGWHYFLQPVRDIHLYSANIGNRIGSLGDINLVRSLLVLAILIMIIAIVNFVNLSTARASGRALEIGVKKVLGAHRRTLMSQFQIESITLTAMATLISLPILAALQRLISDWTGVTIALDHLWSGGILLVLLSVPLVIGSLAGLYPSLYLTSFRPIQVLKGKLSAGVKSSGLRNALVLIQFVISISLIAGTLLVFQQLRFLTDTDLGYDKDQMLVINNAEKLRDQVTTFRNTIMQFPGVEAASVSMEVPGRGSWEDIFSREGADIKLPISQIKIDEHFFPTMGLQLVAGRSFDDDRAADDHAVIINETTARMFDWTNEQALDKQIIYPGYPTDLRIIGVVNDFHFQSLHQNIAPLAFFNLKSHMWGDQRVVVVKYRADNAEEVLANIEGVWDQHANLSPFEYAYYDRELEQLYEDERRLGRLFGIFSAFSIFISILGLVGLVSYAAEQRKKELGIRKILGASIAGLFVLMNQQYLKLIAVALAISTPLAWWGMARWLEDFAYSVQINPLLFVLAGLAQIIFAIASVSYLVWRAARVSPATVLKDE